MIEIWKDIEGFEGFYKVSNLGNVKSVKRVIDNNSLIQGKQTINERILKNQIHSSGYYYITLHREGKRLNRLIHRLVAEAFIDNPNNYQEINHIDENKHNNCVDNLEWCDHTYNNNYGTKNERSSETRKTNKIGFISVNIYDLNDNYICSAESIAEAQRITGCCSSNIGNCCRGYKIINNEKVSCRDNVKNYKFKYKENGTQQ